MKKIKFTAFSDQGNYRIKNQDNLYCPDGFIMPGKNPGMNAFRSGQVVSGSGMVCGVFDGMGGEQAGETAAYLAASEMKKQFAKGIPVFGRLFPEKCLKDYCSRANRAVNNFRKERKYRSVGTTAAVVMAAGNRVCACNVGDSRIYRISGSRMEQVSEDHVQKSGLFLNAPLTQYLGVPDDEMALEPAVVTFPYRRGERYLLCTDGIWNFGTDMRIEEAVTGGSGEEAVKELFRMAEEFDSKDNMTAILLELG